MIRRFYISLRPIIFAAIVPRRRRPTTTMTTVTTMRALQTTTVSGRSSTRQCFKRVELRGVGGAAKSCAKPSDECGRRLTQKPLKARARSRSYPVFDR